MSIVDETIRAKHKEICEKLNIDSATEEKSWQSFIYIKHNYTLDGDAIHWLCCSLYVACKVTVTPTVGSSSSVLQGNCVSLTRLLRICNITLHDFFTKINRWIEMVSIPTEYRKNIEHLKHSFSITMLVYEKYCLIFENLFRKPQAEETKKGKKAKPVPCTPHKLFEFCWTLFICAKAEYPEQSVDLVTSYHMLLSCVDLVFANAVADVRVDLVNADFSGLPPNWTEVNENVSEETSALCIMELLCNTHEGTVVDALVTKEYAWNKVIRKFFETNVLHGDSRTFLMLISIPNFDDNLKSLNSLYDTYILSCGEFDERIVLGPKTHDSHSLSKIKQEKVISESITALNHATPLTGRERLNSKEYFLTPVTTATMSVNKLRKKLTGYNGQPHASLIDLLKLGHPNSLSVVVERLKQMRSKFCEKCRGGLDRFQLAEALYFRLLENICRVEARRLSNNNVVKELCQQDLFNKTLIVCCVEIVIYAYNSQQNFPWILDCFDLHAFHFYKIIEIVVLNHNDHLTRDIIKHLNMIEEQSLEAFAWDCVSPIWEKLEQIDEIPSNQDVDIPAALGADLAGITPHKVNAKPNNGQTRMEIPIAQTQSVNIAGTSSPGEAAKKQLFKDDAVNNNEDQALSEKTAPSANNQSVILSTAGFNSPIKSSLNIQNCNLNGNILVRRTGAGAGSIGLFFRKFYALASIRIKDLCTNLMITSPDLLSQIWTIFEHSITKQTDLMKDRHLDQILMCAIYVFVRIKRSDKTFTDIMKFYRCQPQSASHVYRSVFIARVMEPTTEEVQSIPNNTSISTTTKVPAQPGELAGSSTMHGTEERGDIIRFYNNVYVKVMQDFAMKFSTSVTRDDLLLSPLPHGHSRNQLLSPRKVSERHALYVHALDKKIDTKESPHSIVYQFCESPGKDLERINNIINKGNCKRRMTDAEYNIPSKANKKHTKLNNLIIDRQENCKEK